MPPRLPLLTLFTGGKECSLCEVAKHELAKLRPTTPFDLRLWNIRDPPQGVEAKEAKRWRRLYQYDIPVLHLEDKRIQKHRIDSEALRKVLEEWQVSQGQVGASSFVDGIEKGQGFRPYRSILSWSEPNKRKSLLNPPSPIQNDKGDCDGEDHDDTSQSSLGKKKRRRVIIASPNEEKAPWRRAEGKAFYHLPSPIGEYTPESEWNDFTSLICRTFEGFSQGRIGEDIPILDMRQLAVEREKSTEAQGEMTWEVDIHPTRAWVDGDVGNVIYDEPHMSNQASDRPTNQICWNCRIIGHAHSSCPLPTNRKIVQLSREIYLYQRDYGMPQNDSVLYTLEEYLSSRLTEEKRISRIDLMDRFQPGKISKELEDAICHIIPEIQDEGEEEEVKRMGEEKEKINVIRRRKQWPWLWNISKWGYPPGWSTSKDPIEHLKKKLLNAKVYNTPHSPIETEDDLLRVYGGTLGSPATVMQVATTSTSSSTYDENPADEDGVMSNTESSMSVITASPSRSPLNNHHRLSPQVSPPIDDLPLPPPDDCPPPPPDDFIPAPPPEQPPPPINNIRWVHYHTDLFDSDRLMVYSEACPVPLGYNQQY